MADNGPLDRETGVAIPTSPLGTINMALDREAAGSGGDAADPHTSLAHIISQPTMDEVTQTLATGPAAGPSAQQSLAAMGSVDYDRGEVRAQPTEMTTNGEPIPGYATSITGQGGDALVDGEPRSNPDEGGATDDSGGAPGTSQPGDGRMGVQNSAAGGYSLSGDPEVKGVSRSDPSEDGAGN